MSGAHRIQKRVVIPGTGVTHSCELSCVHLESTPSPLEEQPMLLTLVSSPQSCFHFFFKAGPVSLYIPAQPGNQHVDQVGLEPVSILLSLPPWR